MSVQRVVFVSLEAQTKVHVTILADGVVVKAEACPRCSAETLVVRGPGYHFAAFECMQCGAVSAPPPERRSGE